MNTQRNIIINQKIDLSVGLADSADLTSIFSLFLTDVGSRFLEESGKYFMFPFAAAAALTRSLLAWRHAYFANGEAGAVIRALVETSCALAVGAAVLFGVVASIGLGALAPIIFTATLAFKTLFCLGSSIWYGVSALISDKKEEKDNYKKMAYENAVGAVALALATVAIGFVMILAKPIMAILGVIAGVIATGMGIYGWVKSPPTPAYQKNPVLVPKRLSIQNDASGPGLGSTASFQQRLMASPSAVATPRATSPTSPASVRDSDTNVSSPGSLSRFGLYAQPTLPSSQQSPEASHHLTTRSRVA